MGNSEASRCKRCDNWVYDGSPLCPNCLSRHNQVYNHFIKQETNIIDLNESKVIDWVKLFFILVVLIFSVVLYLIFVVKEKELNIMSFPQNAQVFEFDEDLFNVQTNSLLTVETDADYGYYINIINVESDKSVISFFLHPNQFYELSIPIGSYRIYYGLGKEWKNRQFLFGEEGSYFESNFIYIFTEGNGYSFKIKKNGNIEYDELKING